MNNVTIEQVIIGGGVIMAIVNLYTFFRNPVKGQLLRIDKLESHQANDLDRLNRIENDSKEILKTVNVLLNHSIDGNHVDKLKKRKEELDNYMINR